ARQAALPRGGSQAAPAPGAGVAAFGRRSRPGFARRGHFPFSAAAPHAPGSDYVYLKTSHGFVRHNVTIVQESESKAVVTGLQAGDVIALTNPEQNGAGAAKPKKPASAMQAIGAARGRRP
ncbi:MAG: hypothetical protein ACRD2E_09415, partial [Terriglobales bacterium]